MTSPYRPPSCDLPPEHCETKLKPCPMCGFSSPEIIVGTIDLQGYCPVCQMQGPDRATDHYAKQSWNSIPRRSEVMELLRLVEVVVSWDDTIIDTHNFPEDGLAMAHDFKKLRAYTEKLRKELGE